jgi:hypothetical protein
VAISSIVLLLLFTGLLDLARVFYYSVDLHAAAREGARHGAWFDQVSAQNPYLDDQAIFDAANLTLKGAGLNNATMGSGCPGNPPYNAPYPSGAYGSPGQVIVYICYDALGQACGAYSCRSGNIPPAIGDTSWAGKDLDVIVLYNYPFLTGFLSSFLGPGVQVAANEHMFIQGHS